MYYGLLLQELPMEAPANTGEVPAGTTQEDEEYAWLGSEAWVPCELTMLRTALR